MGNLTTEFGIWSPDANDTAEQDKNFATLTASLENGMGVRVKKLESFVGVNLSLTNAYTVPVGGSPTAAVMSINQPYNFNTGMTVNADGSVTVTTAGLYQINLNANFLPASTTPARINTYLYKGGTAIAFSSTYGENNNLRYSNCNIIGVYNLAAGDIISVRCLCADASSVLQAGGGTVLSMALTART